MKVGLGAVVKKVEVDAEGSVTGVWFQDDDGKGETFRRSGRARRKY